MFARVTTDYSRSNHGYAKNISKAIGFLVGEPKAPFFKVNSSVWQWELNWVLTTTKELLSSFLDYRRYLPGK